MIKRVQSPGHGLLKPNNRLVADPRDSLEVWMSGCAFPSEGLVEEEFLEHLGESKSSSQWADVLISREDHHGSSTLFGVSKCDCKSNFTLYQHARLHMKNKVKTSFFSSSIFFQAGSSTSWSSHTFQFHKQSVLPQRGPSDPSAWIRSSPSLESSSSYYFNDDTLLESFRAQDRVLSCVFTRVLGWEGPYLFLLCAIVRPASEQRQVHYR